MANDSSSSKQQCANERHQTAEKIYWLVSSIFSIGAALAAVYGVYVAKMALSANQGQLKVAADAEIASNRAWLYPEKFVIDLPTDGSPVTIMGDNRNVGKEPATEVLFSTIEQSSLLPKRGTDPRFFKIPTSDTCAGYELWTENSRIAPGGPANGSTVFPEESLTYERYLKIPSSGIAASANSQIDNQQSIFYFRSCVGYVTFKVHHKSAFCFYLMFDPIHHKRETYHCPEGNEAN